MRVRGRLGLFVVRHPGQGSSMSDRTADPFLARCSGRKGCRVGSERHHVVERQIDDIGSH